MQAITIRSDPMCAMQSVTSCTSARAACSMSSLQSNRGRCQMKGACKALESTTCAMPTTRTEPTECSLSACFANHMRLGTAGMHGQAVTRQIQRARVPQRMRMIASSIASTGGAATDVGVFPAGKGQGKVRLPAVWFQVEVPKTTGSSNGMDAALERINAAVAGGATAIVLSANGSGDSDLYNAACSIKETLRGRAALLVYERTDIADAAEADGVLLSPASLPTGVARRMMAGSASLVGRIVANASEAATASKEGANFVILQARGNLAEEAAAARRLQRGNGVPLLVSLPPEGGSRSDLLSSGIDGAYLAAGDAALQGGSSSIEAILRQLIREDPAQQTLDSRAGSSGDAPSVGMLGQTRLMDEQREDLVEAERQLLTDALELLDEACPQMDERSLLRDALKQLDELFLLVVVGEFNSGKSSVINALLGGRFLEEGILPTTNDISVLKYADNSDAVGSNQNEDGFYERRLSAALLRDVNVVDTPGTNVILERQQRLTEEYVPRADLVLFVMSADRPFTDSEVNFLKYIRKWGKKIVFLVNKVDILAGDDEVQEVVDFVASNAGSLLGVEAARVMPVSARPALAAKLEAGGSLSGGQLSSHEANQLKRSDKWRSSRFEELEAFVLDFLCGGKGSGEAVRLKLQTPLFVADALLEAAGRQLQAELQTAEDELEAVSLVEDQLASFAANMERDSAAQRAEAAAAVSAAASRGGAYIDSTLQLGNPEALTTLIFGSRRSQARLPAAAEFETAMQKTMAGRLQRQVAEHTQWLSDNCNRQVANYRAFAEDRAAQLGTNLQQLLAGDGAADNTEQRRQWRQQRQAGASTNGSGSSSSGAGGSSDTSDTNAKGNTHISAATSAPTKLARSSRGTSAVVAVADFDTAGLTNEVQDVVRTAAFGSAGRAMASVGTGAVGTWFLNGTLEDLLSLALGASVAYVSVVNLPLQRREAKDRLRELCDAFIQDVQGRLAREVEDGTEGCRQDVLAFIRPLQRATAAEAARVQAALEQRAALVERLEELKLKAAAVE